MEAKNLFQKKLFSQDIAYLGLWIQRDTKKIAGVFLGGTRAVIPKFPGRRFLVRFYHNLAKIRFFKFCRQKNEFQKHVSSQDIAYLGLWIQRDTKKIAGVFMSMFFRNFPADDS